MTTTTNTEAGDVRTREQVWWRRQVTQVLSRDDDGGDDDDDEKAPNSTRAPASAAARARVASGTSALRASRKSAALPVTSQNEHTLRLRRKFTHDYTTVVTQGTYRNMDGTMVRSLLPLPSVYVLAVRLNKARWQRVLLRCCLVETLTVEVLHLIPNRHKRKQERQNCVVRMNF